MNSGRWPVLTPGLTFGTGLSPLSLAFCLLLSLQVYSLLHSYLVPLSQVESALTKLITTTIQN